MKPLLFLAGAVALTLSGAGLAKPGMGERHGPPFGFGAAPGYGAGPGWLHGHGHHGAVGYGVGGCPPGLAKKAIPCVPPGQARKLGLGLPVPMGYRLLGYRSLPWSVRTRHRLSMSSRYVYSGGILYQVNPRTRTVIRIVR